MNKVIQFVMFTGLALTGCTLAPGYKQPGLPVAATWPDQEPAGADGHATNVVAGIGWRDFFRDPSLQEVIGLALTNNRDLRVAVLNAEIARAQYRIQRAQLVPDIDANGSFVRQRSPSFELFPGLSAVNSQYSVNLGTTAYEVDLFGRIRSLKAQALENYFATGEARRAARITLVAEVANQYLARLELEKQLAIARQTLATVQSAYELNQQSFEAGGISELDLRTAEAQVAAATVSVASYGQLRKQADNALVLLIGCPLPPDLAQAQSLDDEKLLADLPPGLPSDLLQRRPDILEAEHRLKAANANIGAARAAFFPTVKITADAGVTSQQFSGLFAGGSGVWLFNPQVTVPIFSSVANKAALDVASLGKQVQIADYEKAIQTAFREVADALAAKQFLDDQFAGQQRLVQAGQRRYDLADARYRNGADSYLAVLTAQQDLYNARENLAQIQYSRLANLVALYQSLGGGWLDSSNHGP